MRHIRDVVLISHRLGLGRRGGSRSPSLAGFRAMRSGYRRLITRRPHTPTAAKYETIKLCYFFPCARTPKTPCSAHDGVPKRPVDGPRRGRYDLFPRMPLSSRREDKAETEALAKKNQKKQPQIQQQQKQNTSKPMTHLQSRFPMAG